MMNRILVIIFGILFLQSPSLVQAVPFTPCPADICESGPGGDIDTLADHSDDLVIQTLTLGSSGFITDLDVFVAITGPFSSHISFSIEHLGSTVDLFTASVDQFSSDSEVTFDDEATSIVPNSGGMDSYQTNSGDLLSVFDGLEISGDWIFRAEDRIFPEFNDGNHFDWALIATVSAASIPVPEPETLLLMTTGLLGLFAYKRQRTNKA